MSFRVMAPPPIWRRGGDLAEAYYVDQSPYKILDTFDELATRNAGRVYEQMEFE